METNTADADLKRRKRINWYSRNAGLVGIISAGIATLLFGVVARRLHAGFELVTPILVLTTGGMIALSIYFSEKLLRQGAWSRRATAQISGVLIICSAILVTEMNANHYGPKSVHPASSAYGLACAWSLLVIVLGLSLWKRKLMIFERDGVCLDTSLRDYLLAVIAGALFLLRSYGLLP